MGDSGDHAAEQSPHGWRLEAAKPQRVHAGDRAGAHGENVADNAADAGCRPLERLDRAWMVVRLDLERHAQPVAHVDHSGVLLPGGDDDLGRLRGERLEQRPGVFVGAMLTPHHGEDAQLGEVRLPAENLEDVLVFLRRDPVFLDDFRGDLRLGHQGSRRAKGGASGGETESSRDRLASVPATGRGKIGS